jgi:tetratricopeptide (TPR) repeat protein
MHSELLRTSEYIQFRRGVRLRLIASLIVVGHALEPLSIVKALKREEISPEEKAELSYREAEAHGLLGRYDQALGLYQKASSGSLARPLDKLAHFHSGEILYNRGEFSRALRELKIALTRTDADDPHRDIFVEWVTRTLRAAGNTEPEETVS